MAVSELRWTEPYCDHLTVEATSTGATLRVWYGHGAPKWVGPDRRFDSVEAAKEAGEEWFRLRS